MPPNIHICRERKISFELLYFGMTGAPLGLESSLRKERRTFPKCYFIEKETLILSFSPSCLHRIMKLWINKYFLVPTISFITQRTHFIKEIQARIFQIASNKDPMRWNLWIPEALQAEARASESKNLFHCTFSWRCKILPTLRSWEFHSSMRQKGVSSPGGPADALALFLRTRSLSEKLTCRPRWLFQPQHSKEQRSQPSTFPGDSWAELRPVPLQLCVSRGQYCWGVLLVFPF